MDRPKMASLDVSFVTLCVLNEIENIQFIYCMQILYTICLICVAIKIDDFCS